MKPYLIRTAVAAVNVAAVASAARAAPVLTTLAPFNGTNGANPFAGLTADAAGNLYGTTYNGGTGGDGTVFEVAVGTHALSTLVTFDGGNGANPKAVLTADAAGNLYGTTVLGGANNIGTVYEVAAGTHALTTLATFNGANGADPSAGLTADATGNLYGTSNRGGADGDGTVFEIAAGTRALTTLATFDGVSGARPQAGLTADAAGNLYGTTGTGGSGAFGTVFEVAAGTGVLTTLATFNSTNGATPYGGLTADAVGDLYGTTYYGGANGDGTVYEVAAGTRALTTLATFDSTNGANPYVGLTADAAGDLYGTTGGGGANGDGTVFEIAAGTRVLTTLATFDDTNGTDPKAGLTADAAGNLYGTTTYGGANFDGTVYELTGTGFAVPEPASAGTLTAMAGLALLRRPRR